MRKKNVFQLIFLVMTLLLTTVLSFTIVGASNIDDDRIEYNDKVYYGKTINMSNVSSFSMNINQTEFTKDKPFLEFINTPNVIGNRSEYTPDYQKLVITLTDTKNKSNKLKIQLFPRRDGNSHTMAISAGATGQNMLGEYFATKIDQKDELSSDYPAMIPYTFDGYTRENRFIDYDGNKVEFGKNGKIALYYDNLTKTLYTDTGLNNVKAHEKNNNKNLWRIRDFKKTDYLLKKNNGEKVICLDKAWNGFTKNADILITMSIEDIVLGKNPSFKLLTIGGKSMFKKINIESLSYAVKGCKYLPPTPTYYDYKNLKDKVFDGQYKVLDPDGEEIVPMKNFSDVSSFDTAKEGEYKIYYYKNNEENFLSIISKPESTEGSIILPMTEEGLFYQGDKVNVGVDVKNNLQIVKPVVDLKISHGTAIKKEIKNLGINYDYTFDEYGDYTLEYSSIDYVGRKTIKRIDFNVSRYFPVFAEGIVDGQRFNCGKEVVISKDDLRIYDIPLQHDFYPSDVSIEVKVNNQIYRPLDQVSFDVEGKYLVRYRAKYSADKIYNIQADRTFYIYDEESLSINISDDITKRPTNTKFLGKKDGLYNYAGLKGKEIKIPDGFITILNGDFVTVDNNELIFAELQYGNKTFNITDKLKSGTFSFIPDEYVKYSIILQIKDSSFSSKLILKFNIKEKWLHVKNIEDVEVNIGDKIPNLYPVIQDFYGNIIPNDKIHLSIYCCGENVPIKDFKIDKFAIYNVHYSCVFGDETLNGNYNIIGIDTQPPAITLQNHETAVGKNNFVQIAEYEIQDNSGIDCSVDVQVYKNNQSVLVYNNGFNTDEYGTYVVKYYVTDAVGNVTEKEYTIEVDKKYDSNKSCSSFISSSGFHVDGIVIVCTFVLLIILTRKNLYLKRKRK